MRRCPQLKGFEPTVLSDEELQALYLSALKHSRAKMVKNAPLNDGLGNHLKYSPKTYEFGKPKGDD